MMYSVTQNTNIIKEAFNSDIIQFLSTHINVKKIRCINYVSCM